MPVARDLVQRIERPDGSVFYTRTDTDQQICGSPRRKKDDNCAVDRRLSPWNGRCRLHGANSPGAPITSAMGRGTSVRKRLASLLGDPSLLDMRRPLSVLALACERAMKRLDSLDTPAYRKHSQRLIKRVEIAATEGAIDLPPEFEDLKDWIDQGAQEDAAFKDFVGAARDLLHGQEKGWKVALDSKHSLSQPQLAGIFADFFDGVRQICTIEQAKEFEEWVNKNIITTSGLTIGKE